MDELGAALAEVVQSVSALGVSAQEKTADSAVTEKGPALTASEIKPMLVDLLGLLAASDTGAEELTSSVAQHLPALDLAQEGGILERQVSEFDFDKAQETLKRIAKALGISL